jgi:hypothetical protein
MPQVKRTPPTRDATAARAAPRQPVAAFARKSLYRQVDAVSSRAL